MTNPTWDGIEIDYTLLPNYGWYRTNITVGGESYPLLVGYQVAGLREMDARLVATGGSVPSIRYAWDTETTDADPGAGELRGNNATIASITQLYVSTADAAGVAVSAILDTWDDSTSTVKGRLRLAHRTDATKWAEFTLSAVTSATGYRKLTVAYVAGSGTLSAADPVALGFVRTGDKGDTGTVAAAADGTVSAPGISFAAETSTGIRRVSAGVMALVTAGVDALRLTRLSSTAATLLHDLTHDSGSGFSGRNQSAGSSAAYRVTLGNNSDSDDARIQLNGSGNTSLAGARSLNFLANAGLIGFFFNRLSPVAGLLLETVPSAARALKIKNATNGGDPELTTSDGAGAIKAGRAARGTVVALTDGATITFDMNAGNDAAVTLGGNRTFGAPSNVPAGGQGGSVFFTQDATGSRTLSFNGVWQFRGGNVPTLSITAGAVDRLDYVVKDATHIHCELAKDVK